MKKDALIEIIREEIEQAIKERELTPSEEKHKEKMVKKLKGKAKDFKKKYGDEWKSVMYGVATKQAKNKSKEDTKDG